MQVWLRVGFWQTPIFSVQHRRDLPLPVCPISLENTFPFWIGKSHIWSQENFSGESKKQDVYELPTDSVRELIANAVVHRSYLEPGNIQVALFDDRLEVTSPGMLLNNVSIKKMMEGYSKPRNPAIARAFAYMKIIEKWGTGIPRMFRECREYGLPEPKLIDFDGDFRVNIYRKNSEQHHGVTEKVIEKVTEKEEEVLALLLDNPEITMAQLAEKLEISRKTVAVRLKSLKEKGIIQRIGSDRKGYWKVV